MRFNWCGDIRHLLGVILRDIFHQLFSPHFHHYRFLEDCGFWTWIGPTKPVLWNPLVGANLLYVRFVCHGLARWDGESEVL